MQLNNMIDIDDVVNILNLERDPKGMHRTDSYNVKCPFCCDRKYHMNINCEKNLYRCAKCSFDERNLTALDLYGRVRLGVRFIPGVSGNGKELSMALREEMFGYAGSRKSEYKEKANTKSAHMSIYPADDKSLDAVYSALLNLDYLRLCDEHMSNLLCRGLDTAAVLKNGYATFPSPHDILDKHPKAYAAEEKYMGNLIQEKAKYSKLKYKKDACLVAGMLIANDLLLKGLKLDGVPGFFKLGKTWFLNYEQGMIIPTRNSEGEIVCLQIRKDNVSGDGLRYITLSASDLKNGVNNSISRVHFPIANSFSLSGGEIPENGRVIITEGPLKADIAATLYTDAPAMFIAVQGVNNIKEMPDIAAALSDLGVNTVYNAFDMDKICNPYVAKAGSTLANIFKSNNIRCIPMFWDYEGRIEAYMENLTSFMSERNIAAIPCNNSISFVSKNISRLLSQNPDGYFEFKEAYPWQGEKGIDDYLLAISK